MIWLFATLLLVFATDRCIKSLARAAPALIEGKSIGPLLTLRVVHNSAPRLWPGESQRAWATSFIAALLASLLWLGLNSPANVWAAVGFGALLGGALGNLYDRLRHGAVIDLLSIGRLGFFNTADVALALGLFLILGATLR